MHAGARASVGMKAGRYMFEVKVVEHLSPEQGRPDFGVELPQPRQLVKIGFASANATSLLDEGAEQVYFDSEGNFVSTGERQQVTRPIRREQIVAVVLNLDESSPCKNTLSLFVDGVRAAKPQKLPSSMHGKALYPIVAYKGVSLQVNFGPSPMKALPFKCRMLQDASTEDIEGASAMELEAEVSKPVALFPVGLPDSGLFDWLDMHLAANPKIFELSDRKVLGWAQKSGCRKVKGHNANESQDKPTINFGIPGMDDNSIQKTLAMLVTSVPRPVVSMEVKANLVAEERKEILNKFPASLFKRVAMVVMGEPPAAYKEKVLELMLAEKMQKVEAERDQKVREEKDRKARERAGVGTAGVVAITARRRRRTIMLRRKRLNQSR